MTRIDRQKRPTMESLTERALQRRTKHNPKDGIGFTHNSAKVEREEVKAWLGSLPESVRASLADPRTEIVVTARTSGSGGKELNEKLAAERANNFMAELDKTAFVQARVRIRTETDPRTGELDLKQAPFGR